MRIPLLHADFEHGSYTKIAKALRKAWPVGGLSLMQSQNALAIVFGYNSQHDARREALETFPLQDGSLSMKAVESSVVRQLFLRYGIDPLSGRAIVERLHLDELAVASISAEATMRRLVEAAVQEGTGGVETKDPSTARIVVDEAGYYFGRSNDTLREVLREVEGIPNATYVVRGERVFVFAKLVQLVDAVGMKHDEPDFQATAKRLVELACVSPEEAISQWKVMPEPYEFEEVAGGDVVIRHKPFNARVPGHFSSQDAAQPALTRLLMGEVVTGTGELEYKAQPLILREPLELDGFTMTPPVVTPVGEPRPLWLTLAWVEWREGFAAVPESLFLQAKETTSAWQHACAAMKQLAEKRPELIWADADSLDLGRLNSALDVVWEDGREQIEGLRACYPELAMLSDATLWSQFDTYQTECWGTNSWEPRREEDFVFFLIGRRADPAGHAYSATTTGTWAAYHLMGGNSLEDALWFACQVRFNSGRANALANRIADAMRFLEDEAQATDRRGRKIATFGDMMRMGRKRVTPVMVTQDTSQLSL